MIDHLEIVLDVQDLKKMISFWSEALGYVNYDSDANRYSDEKMVYASLVDPTRKGPKLIFQKVKEAKQGKNRLHFDLYVADLNAEANRLVSLGAKRVDVNPITEVGSTWIRMQDVEGHEFCVIRNR